MVHMSNNARASRDIGCLVISPTRELAQQIGAETEKLLHFQRNFMRKVVVCVNSIPVKRFIHSCLCMR